MTDPINWQTAALCAQSDPDTFFPDVEAANNSQVKAAKKVCANCDAQDDCLTYALETHQPHGIWAGLTTPERRLLRQTDVTDHDVDVA